MSLCEVVGGLLGLPDVGGDVRVFCEQKSSKDLNNTLVAFLGFARSLDLRK